MAEWFVYVVENEVGTQHYVSPVPPPEIAAGVGLAPEAIAGVLREQPAEGGPGLSPDNFQPNRDFRLFLHAFLAMRAPVQPDFIAEAAHTGEGWVYLVDGRTGDPSGEVPPSDILGAFAVAGGTLTPDAYRPNPNHKLMTDRGLVELPGRLDQELVEVLIQRCRNPPADP